jgi:hypothetical protein
MKIRTATQWQRNLPGWAVVAFAVGALAACHGGSTASTDTAASTAAATETVSAKAGDPAATSESLHSSGIVTNRKACDLLTRADAEAAVGQPLPQNTVNLTLGMCDYNAADFSAGASLTVGSWESIKNAATSGAHQPQAISGIGDEALYFASEKGASPMYVRRGNEGFLLVLNGTRIDHMAGADAVAVQKDLALKILKRF